MVFAGLVLTWRLAPVQDPEPLVGWLLCGAVAGAVIESLIVASQRARADQSADELIEEGFVTRGRSDEVSRAIEARLRELESERTRSHIAEHLRWHVQLEQQCRHLAGAPRPPLPHISGFAQNAELVDAIANYVERGPCDPRVVIRINHLLVTPAPLRDTLEARLISDSERIRAALLDIQSLIDRADS